MFCVMGIRRVRLWIGVVLGTAIFIILLLYGSERILANHGILPYIEVEEFLQSSPEIDINLSIPIIKGLEDQLFQETINSLFRYRLLFFANRLGTLARKHHREVSNFYFQYTAINDYEVYFFGDIISFVLLLYQYTGGAHGLSVKESFTIDYKEREFLSLSLFFEKESYREMIQGEIERQIEENRGDFFKPLTNLDFHEDNFYVSEEGIHIYYHLYSIAPYARGIPIFLIPWEMIREWGL